MKKQIDFDIRVFDIKEIPSEQGMSHEEVRKFIQDNYLAFGWEVLGVENTQIAARHAFFAVYLVKYEEVSGVVPLTKLPNISVDDAVVKRGPGRPKKVESEQPQ